MGNPSKIEEWRPVAGFENEYEVSYFGRVRRVRSPGVRGGVLSTPKNLSGYPFVLLSKDNKPKNKPVHRLVAEAFDIPGAGEYVNHIDGDRGNPAAYNLEWCDQSGNMNHRFAAAAGITDDDGMFYPASEAKVQLFQRRIDQLKQGIERFEITSFGQNAVSRYLKANGFSCSPVTAKLLVDALVDEGVLYRGEKSKRAKLVQQPKRKACIRCNMHTAERLCPVCGKSDAVIVLGGFLRKSELISAVNAAVEGAGASAQ